MRFIFLFLLIFLPYSTSAEDAKKDYSITEFKSSFRPEGTYTIRAYVAQAFECPPCPPGAQCGPCNDFIVLSDKGAERCSTIKLCDDELLLPVRDANHLAEGKRAGKLPYLTTIYIGGIELREMLSVEADESIKRMLKKDPDLREKNPIKWMQENYELQDKSVKIKP